MDDDAMSMMEMIGGPDQMQAKIVHTDFFNGMPLFPLLSSPSPLPLSLLLPFAPFSFLPFLPLLSLSYVFSFSLETNIPTDFEDDFADDDLE